MDHSDIELMIQYQNGSEEAFNELYTRHKGKTFGYILKKTKDKDLAEEIFQDIFQKLHVHKLKFNPDREFLPWFFVLVHNVIIDHMRKLKQNHQEFEDVYPSKIDTNQSINEVEELSKLSVKEQEALKLKFNNDYDYEEISLELGITQTYARKIVSRALSKLKSVMGVDSE